MNHINRPPALNDIANQSTDENVEVRFSINGSDEDTEDAGQLVFGASSLPEGAAFNADTRLFIWTPTFEQSGSYELLFNISDPSGLTDAKTVVLDVAHVNRTPTLNPVTDITKNENEAITFQLSATDPDVENANTLTYELDNLPEGMVINPNSGSVSWTPTFDQSGNYALTARVNDGSGLKAERNFTIDVTNVNRPPAFNPVVAQTVAENNALEYSVTAIDPDKEDTNKLVYSASNLPEGAVLSSSEGIIRWSPTYEQSGTYTVDINVVDSFGSEDATIVTINVDHVNRSPVLSDINNLNLPENEDFSMTLPEASDADKEDSGGLTYRLNGLPSGASFDPATRQISWTPSFEDAGVYQLTYVAGDGDLDVNKEFTLQVINVNRSPELQLPENQTVREGETINFNITISDPDSEDADNLTLRA
ncbi:MAG: putative Ig domain-containing protein, partial [Calditrichota bacterium]